MIRLLWLAAERADPEEAFPQLQGRRPAPEALSFSDATPEKVSRSLAQVILVDGRGHPAEAAAVVRKLRFETDPAFVVVLSSSDSTEFDWSCGAADFLTDTSSSEELDVRIIRAAHPFEPEEGEILRRGEITINRERFEVRVRGEILDLTYKEFELLQYLAARPGKVCSRRELLTEVWGYEFFGGTRTVDVHIRRLRAKLGPASGVIETVRNVGYRFAG